MYCPKCRDEFQSGFDTCPDCKVDLVAKLPAEEHPEVVVVAQIPEAGLLPVISSVLEASGLPYAIEGAEAMSIHPGVAVAGAGSAGRVVAPAEHAAAIRELLSGLDEFEAFDREIEDA